jgi:hypothetical protein
MTPEPWFEIRNGWLKFDSERIRLDAVDRIERNFDRVVLHFPSGKAHSVATPSPGLDTESKRLLVALDEALGITSKPDPKPTKNPR